LQCSNRSANCESHGFNERIAAALGAGDRARRQVETSSAMFAPVRSSPAAME
jgi:hypothetical protein